MRIPKWKAKTNKQKSYLENALYLIDSLLNTITFCLLLLVWSATKKKKFENRNAAL